MAGIYLHIPYCKQACHYCDFHFSTSTGSKDVLINSLATELRLQSTYLSGESIETIYFGGGTPSLLEPPDFQTLYAAIRRNFKIGSSVEITVEANPDDLTRDKLTSLHDLGVNRLSIGIQSFDDKVLTFLNRAHDAVTASTSLKLARECGFANISLDLIYGIPGQDDEQWITNINKAIELAPEHISSYSLTIEEKTVFGNWDKKGTVPNVDDERSARQLEILMEMLGDAGYDQYEISNFARPGYYSRHNSNYWKGEKYLGVGPSAHSFNGNSRQYNVRNNNIYIRSIASGKIPFEHETLSRADKINEYLLTTLRTMWGCDLQHLIECYNYDLLVEHNSYLAALEKNKLATIEKGILRLTNKGKLLADKIASDLFVIEHQTSKTVS